jgi:hypothetical protein
MGQQAVFKRQDAINAGLEMDSGTDVYYSWNDWMNTEEEHVHEWKSVRFTEDCNMSDYGDDQMCCVDANYWGNGATVIAVLESKNIPYKLV